MKHLFYVIGCLLISTTCLAQQPLTDSLAARMRMYAPKAGETVIYLRCNKDVYMPGEDLWFSAFVLQAQAFTLSGLDKILYVQLSRRDNDSTIWQEMYPIEGGLSSGHIYLPDTLSNGDYLLKGYSAHSFFGRKYFYAAAPITIATKPLAGGKAMSAVPAKGSADLQVCSLTEDSVTFELKTAQPQQIYLRVQTRGLLQSIASGMLKDSLRVTIPIKEMPAGMAEATLYDAQLRPLTSTWFNAHPERRLHISFTEVKEEYGVKAAISVRIKTTDADGKPVPAALTLRVTDHLFLNAANARDIAGYYYEETQLTGEVDLNKTMPILSDSLRGTVTPLSRKDPKSLSLLVFNYNKSISQFAATNNEGVFYLTPEHLAMGRRFFVRYFSDKEYKVQIAQPFKAIAAAGKPIYQLREKALIAADSRPDTNLMQYGRTLQGVQIQSKGRGFSDKYLGYLDSIARFEGNTDFVGVCGGLNCPACGSGTKPEEGVTYWELTEPRRSQVFSHPFSYGANDMRQVTYKYPRYTEEELMKKFKMAVTAGFYTGRQFYAPDYDREDKTLMDTRNTLYWHPAIITNENGEAEIRFFSSDIRGKFVGVAEGLDGSGDLGVGRFEFFVK